MLTGGGHHRIRQAAVAHDTVGGEPHPAGRRDNAAAPVAEAVAIRKYRHCGTDGEVIGNDDVGRTREMRAEHHDHRCRLRELVQHFESDTQFHSKCFPVDPAHGYEATKYKVTAAYWGK